MTNFADIVAGAATEIFGRLGGPVTLVPADGGGEVTVLAILKRPAQDSFLREAAGVRELPEVHIPVSERAILKKLDVVIAEGRRWRVAEAPQRAGHGFTWVAQVEDLGAA